MNAKFRWHYISVWSIVLVILKIASVASVAIFLMGAHWPSG